MSYYPNNYVNPYSNYNSQQSQLQQPQMPQMQNNQFPQMQQSQFQQPQQYNNMLKGKKVSTLEEAKASEIDFDGNTFYFPSVDNKSIYTKQVGLDGNVSILEYKLSGNVTNANQQESNQQTNSIDYINIIDKQNTIIEGLNNRLSQLENKTENLFKELGGK